MLKNNSIFKDYLITITILIIFGLLLKLIFANKIYYSLLPLLFFFVSVGTFARAVLGGYVLYPITWYILAVGIYFGLGLFGTTIPVSEYTTLMFGKSPNFIIDIFIINTTSVFIICYISIINVKEVKKITVKYQSPIFKIASLSIIVGYILVKIITFPEIEDLVLKSLFNKYIYISYATFFVCGYFFIISKKSFKIITAICLIAAYFIGIVAASKYQSLMPLLSFFIGLGCSRANLKIIFYGLLMIILAFIFNNIIINTMRIHGYYEDNNLLEKRILIANQALSSTLGSDILIKKTTNSTGKVELTISNLSDDYKVNHIIKSVLLRFDIGTIQKFVFDRYNEGYPGDSFQRIPSTIIPRIFWKNKPAVIDEGKYVNTLLYPGQVTSSAAVSYVGEAYWNKGVVGVIFISTLIGISFYIFNWAIKKFYSGEVYYSITIFPIILYALSIESWLGVTYLANFIHIISLIILSKIINLTNYSKLND